MEASEFSLSMMEERLPDDTRWQSSAMRALTGNQPWHPLDHGLPSFRTKRRKFLSFKHPSYGILLGSLPR